GARVRVPRGSGHRVAASGRKRTEGFKRTLRRYVLHLDRLPCASRLRCGGVASRAAGRRGPWPVRCPARSSGGARRDLLEFRVPRLGRDLPGRLPRSAMNDVELALSRRLPWGLLVLALLLPVVLVVRDLARSRAATAPGAKADELDDFGIVP